MTKKIPYTLFLFLAAFFLRLLFLGKNDLWTDEASTIIQTQSVPFGLGPPLYYLILKTWTALFGTSEAMLRLPSALFSAASLPVLYALAKKMFGRRVALLSTLIMALSAFHLWYAQEARSYTMTLFLGLISTSYLYNFTREGKNSDLGLFVAFSTANLYTNYFSLPLLIFQGIYGFLFISQPLRRKAFMLLPFFLASLRSWAFVKEWTHVFRGFWIPTPIPSSLLITFENFICGYSGTAVLYGLSSLLTLLTFFFYLFQLREKPVSKEIALLAFLSFAPVLAVYLYSNIFSPIYLDRGLIIFSPYFYILLACAILWIPSRLLRRILTASLILSLSVSTVLYFLGHMYGPRPYRHHIGAFLKKPYKPLADFLKNERRDNDLVLFAFTAPVYPLCYYMGAPQEEFFSFSRHVYDPEAQDTNSKRPFAKVYRNAFYIPAEGALENARKREGRVFLIAGTFPRNGDLDDNSQRVKDFFDRRLLLSQALDFDGTKVFVYDRASASFAPKTSKE